MKKSTLRTLCLTSLALLIIGVLLLLVSLFVVLANPQASGGGFLPLGTLALILLIAGAILFLIAWIGALILTARLGRWGWFAAIFFFTLIGLLAYSLVGPETPASSPQSLQS